MRRPDLVADCTRCAAVCCVATAYQASEDFAADKQAGERCVHLAQDDRCGIYAQRVERGFSGCLQFDCYGAGQRVTQAFGAARGRERDEAFVRLRAVHELLFQLSEALPLCPPDERALRDELAALIEVLDAIDPLRMLDVAPYERLAHALLRRVGVALGGRRQRMHLQLLR
jgi:hypothetical protein